MIELESIEQTDDNELYALATYWERMSDGQPVEVNGRRYRVADARYDSADNRWVFLGVPV